ncbi:DNA photolyase, FAD-binding/Cryptochrome [Lanmaoa asiatica]|nr:DNA photolyase, FAD-binding/Cryptochrome [Lanmaoa asiatica]
MSKRARSPSPASMSKKGRTAHPFAPRKIATAEAAAAAQANPPFLRMLAEMRNVTPNPQPGKSIIYWMRMGDLRIVDNRALAAASKQAVQNKIPLIVLFLLSPEDYIAHDRSKRRIDFVLRNLSEIKKSLAELDVPLHTVSHTPRHTIPSKVISLLESFQCTRMFANMEYEVDELRRDLNVLDLSKEKGIRPHYFHDRSVVEPGVIKTKAGKTHTVYSPYQRLWITELNEKISTYLEESPLPEANPSSIRQDLVFGTLFNTPVPHFVEGFELHPADREKMVEVWPAGSAAAQEVLSRFLNTKSRASQLGTADPLADGAEISDKRSRILMYAEKRDQGDQDTTSRLSPYLSAGVISPRECIRATMTLTGTKKVDAGRTTGIGRWVQELGTCGFTILKKLLTYYPAWRDFYINVLANFPRVSMGRPFQERLANVRWEVNEEHLAAWKQGKTGIPIVDAAMRQINTMGWMHNRMRMIAAMFLSKDLMLDWRLGEQYFMEQLVDGDLASNNGGWQWSASTGADPAPYFRIFNPYMQSARADPTGDYIRMYVPELKNLRGPGGDIPYPRKHIGSLHEIELHNPPGNVADKLGYPRPIVEHAEVRERAIRRYKNPGQE